MSSQDQLEAKGVELETPRLRLRLFAPDKDLDRYSACIFENPAVTRYLPARDTPPRERAQRTMEFFNQHWEHYPYGPWAVEDKASGELIGHCGLRYIPEIDETEVLYALAQETWGQGIATEAARASVDYGFTRGGLKRIIALAMPANVASRRVMEHCGLRYEKETHLFGLDVVYYVLDRQDYKGGSKLA